MKRAENYDDIRHLIDFCKDGRVLEALQWVKDGKPLDPPTTPLKSTRKRYLLQYAIDFGCHSMVQVLLEGGAEVEQNNRYDALLDAVRCARFDFIKMLVEHGADVRRVDMREVFYTWQGVCRHPRGARPRSAGQRRDREGARNWMTTWPGWRG